MATCRGCGEEIRWEKTRQGKAMPLDPEPTSAGNVVLESLLSGGPRVAVTLAPEPAARYTGEKFMPHWKTCPNASDFRGRG